jgi:carbamoyl-phosphate synthase large subunit
MGGTVFVSVRNQDKPAVVPIARELAELGFELISSSGTHEVLSRAGVTSRRIPKLAEGRPNVIDLMKNGQVHLIINTPTRKGPDTDEGKIRATAVLSRVPMITTTTGARAAVGAIRALQSGDWGVRPLQDYARATGASAGPK